MKKDLVINDLEKVIKVIRHETNSVKLSSDINWWITIIFITNNNFIYD